MRRWHRRLRLVDRQIMLPEFNRLAAKEDADPSDAALAWHLFINDTGQGHWRCRCALLERERG